MCTGTLALNNTAALLWRGEDLLVEGSAVGLVPMEEPGQVPKMPQGAGLEPNDQVSRQSERSQHRISPIQSDDGSFGLPFELVRVRVGSFTRRGKGPTEFWLVRHLLPWRTPCERRVKPHANDASNSLAELLLAQLHGNCLQARISSCTNVSHGCWASTCQHMAARGTEDFRLWTAGGRRV